MKRAVAPENTSDPGKSYKKPKTPEDDALVAAIRLGNELFTMKTKKCEDRKAFSEKAAPVLEEFGFRETPSHPLIKRVVLKHDSTRVLQLIIKYGTAEQKELIWNGISTGASMVETMAQSQYGHHVILKLLHYGAQMKLHRKFWDYLRQSLCGQSAEVSVKLVAQSFSKIWVTQKYGSRVFQFYWDRFALAAEKEQLFFTVLSPQMSSLHDLGIDLYAGNTSGKGLIDSFMSEGVKSTKTDMFKQMERIVRKGLEKSSTRTQMWAYMAHSLVELLSEEELQQYIATHGLIEHCEEWLAVILDHAQIGVKAFRSPGALALSDALPRSYSCILSVVAAKASEEQQQLLWKTVRTVWQERMEAEDVAVYSSAEFMTLLTSLLQRADRQIGAAVEGQLFRYWKSGCAVFDSTETAKGDCFFTFFGALLKEKCLSNASGLLKVVANTFLESQETAFMTDKFRSMLLAQVLQSLSEESAEEEFLLESVRALIALIVENAFLISDACGHRSVKQLLRFVVKRLETYKTECFEALWKPIIASLTYASSHIVYLCCRECGETCFMGSNGVWIVVFMLENSDAMNVEKLKQTLTTHLAKCNAGGKGLKLLRTLL